MTSQSFEKELPKYVSVKVAPALQINDCTAYATGDMEICQSQATKQ